VALFEKTPALVRLGILSKNEWYAIEPSLKGRLDSETLAFEAEYGEAFFLKDRDRHRADLWLAYGVGDPDL
jgi:hypothetical protein